MRVREPVRECVCARACVGDRERERERSERACVRWGERMCASEREMCAGRWRERDSLETYIRKET